MAAGMGVRHYSVDEPITVVEYDQRWPHLFDQEQRRIRLALGDAVIDVQHFGSTAVPGLAAKPIVDVLVGIRTPKLDEGQIASLERSCANRRVAYYQRAIRRRCKSGGLPAVGLRFRIDATF